MKLCKKIAIFTILSTAGLFASEVKYDITSLVHKINNATTLNERSLLLKKLDAKLSSMGQEDLINAQQIINNNLKIFKFI